MKSVGKRGWMVVDSISHLSPIARGRVIVCGSHGGKAAAEYMVKYRPSAAIFNDAGVGKERAGIRALGILDRRNIAGVAVSAQSARIGEGWDTYRSGVVSFVNRTARDLGIRRRMTVRAAVRSLRS